MNPPIPEVSVIIPTYNQADLLLKALQSVINQTFQNWEAIVIDNYSKDNTREIVGSFNDPRIRYTAFSNKGIIAASRNHGIHLATGNYIAFLDSDDLWYPSKIVACLASLNGGADALCHGLCIRKDGILSDKLIPEPTSRNFYEILLYHGNTMIATSSVMIKKECFDRFGAFSEDPGLVTAEDYELWIRFAKNNVRWGLLPEVLGEYIIHSKNASGNVQKQMLAEDRIVMKYFSENSAPSIHEQTLYRKRRMILLFRAGKRVWQSGNYRDSMPYFLKAVYRFFY